MTTFSTKGTALVTGASSGIGAILAQRLANRGYDLILVARNRAQLDTLAERISSETSRSVRVIAADLGNKADLKLVETTLRTDPSITMLVNNAGVGAVEPLLAADIEKMEALIALNVTALTRLTYAVAPALVARGGGTIVNVASVVAIAPELLNGVYGASKAFVLAFSQSLRKELVASGVRVHAVLPGATATNFWDVAGGSVDKLPNQIVMRAENLVDAAIAGVDQGEFVIIPSLPDAADWEAYEAARQKMLPNLSRSQPAERYSADACAA